MSTNEMTLTLVGWVATEPKRYVGVGTTAFTSFRMASTRRYYDRTANVWVDGRTEWFTVKAWRQQAHNVAASLRKSDPVIVHGRLATEEWVGTDGPRTTLVLEALAIGPDLTFGEARFSRTVHVGAGPADKHERANEQVSDPEGDVGVEDPWASDGGAPAGEEGDAVSAGVGSTDADRVIT